MVNNIPSIDAQRKFFVAMCNQANVRVVWSDKKVVPTAAYRNGRATITLSSPTIIGHTEWLWDAHHEVSHLFPEVLFCYKSVTKVQSAKEKDVMNILADFLCEYNRHGEYPGRDRAMFEGLYEFSSKSDEWLLGNDLIIQALVRWDEENRQIWQGYFKLPLIDPLAEPLLEALKGMSLETRLPQLLTTQDPEELYRITKEILEIQNESTSAGAGGIPKTG